MTSEQAHAIIVDDVLAGRTPKATCQACWHVNTRHRCPYGCRMPICMACWPKHRSAELKLSALCTVCNRTRTGHQCLCGQPVCSKCRKEHASLCPAWKDEDEPGAEC